MANIRRITGKNGVAYKITVTKGRNQNGKQMRHYMTWTPDRPMTERQMQKAVERAAMDFERSIEQGYQIDNRQTFAQYAEYVLSEKEQQGAKYRTLDRYRELLERINQGIGYIKLADIRPQHLNTRYKNLAEPGVSDRGGQGGFPCGYCSSFERQAHHPRKGGGTGRGQRHNDHGSVSGQKNSPHHGGRSSVRRWETSGTKRVFCL